MTKRPSNKIMVSPYAAEITRIFNEFKGDLIAKNISKRQLFISKIVPLLPADTDINYQDFIYFSGILNRQTNIITTGKSLIEKEKDKQIQQAEIRQNVTQLMSTFIGALKDLAESPEKMRDAGVKMQDLYKIIREEEDRNKVIGLKERAENRADAQFAFFVSLARAGQLTEMDIEFLNEDVKEELKLLKTKDGIYQLPGEGTGFTPSLDDLEEISTSAEAPVAVASPVNSEGA